MAEDDEEVVVRFLACTCVCARAFVVFFVVVVAFFTAHIVISCPQVNVRPVRECGDDRVLFCAVLCIHA